MANEIKNQFISITKKNVRSVSFLECGYSNDNYLINDAYVLRNKKPNGDPTLLAENELTVYKSIEKLNISEKIFYFDPNSGTKITKYVHGTRKYNKTPTFEEISYVAKKLKKLHTSNIVIPFEYSMFDKLEIYKSNLDKVLYIDKKYENKVIKDIKKIFDKNELVLCHNDLVKDNLLFKHNDVVIIDWEYSAMNNPYFDIASFISENNLEQKESEYFLIKYFGSKLNDIKRKRVDLFVQFQNILFYYWAEYMYKSRNEEIYKAISNIKLERIVPTHKIRCTD